MKTIELWSGAYGSGKTKCLIDEFNKHYCNTCIFIVMDGFHGIFKEHYEIETISFSEAKNVSGLAKNRKIFIDDADIFVAMYGFHPLLEILNEYNEIFISTTCSDFYKSQKRSLKELSISFFLENIQGVKVNKLFLRDNPGILSEYVEMIEKELGYKE